MNRAVKIRIYPNKEQRVQIEKTIGCGRFIYNQMLADKISYYQIPLPWRMRNCIWKVRSGSFFGNQPADFHVINQRSMQEIHIRPMH